MPARLGLAAGAARRWARPVGVVAGRELAAYLATPLAGVFVVVFLAAAGVLTFEVGRFFERGRADLQPFFRFHPWLYLWLAPALAMRLWAEERRTGTAELLLTLPVGPLRAVLGKFLAAWLVAAAALGFTVPLWATVAWLGDPDHGVVAAGYAASLLLAGAYLAIALAASAATRSQAVAFVLALAIGAGLTVPGAIPVAGLLGAWSPDALVALMGWFSLDARFQALVRGVVDPRDVLFLASVAVFFLALATLAAGRTGERP
jgi:ABC-2 type transport system permease protein